MTKTWVSCLGLPVPGFPVAKVDPKQDSQVVWVDYITHRGTTYGTGAYVWLEKVTDEEFKIRDVSLQQHLLR